MTGKRKVVWLDKPHYSDADLSQGNPAAASQRPLSVDPAACATTSSERLHTPPWMEDHWADLNCQTVVLSSSERQQMAAGASSGDAALATTDAELIIRLKECVWLKDCSYRLPTWLGTGDVRGYPATIGESLRDELMRARVEPDWACVDQWRFVRNWTAIWEISRQVNKRLPASDELFAASVSTNGTTALQPRPELTAASEEANVNLTVKEAFPLAQRSQRTRTDLQRQYEMSQEGLESGNTESQVAPLQRIDLHQDVELSTCDMDLAWRLHRCTWLQGRSYKLPPWLSRTYDVNGNPLNVDDDQKAALREGCFMIGENNHCKRFLRNVKVIQSIAAQLKTAYPSPSDLGAKGRSNQSQTVLNPQGGVSRGLQPASQSSSSKMTGTPRTTTVEHPEQPKQNCTAPEDSKVAPDTKHASSASRHPTRSKPRSDSVSPGVSSDAPGSQNHVSLADQERAETLKKTVLAPLYDRITKDGQEIVRLRQEKEALAVEVERHKNQIMQFAHEDDSSDADDEFETLEPRGTKRKAAPPSPMRLGDETNGNNDHTTEGHLAHLANKICKDLGELVANETIHQCGLAPVKIMDDRPDVVLQLAHQKIHTWPYSKVPTCWRRLFEDASLAKAAQMLRVRAGFLEYEPPSKKRRIASANGGFSEPSAAWFGEIVKVLDTGLSLSGAPGRSTLFEAVFQQLENHLPAEEVSSVPNWFNITLPKALNAFWPIGRSKHTPRFEEFQYLLNTTKTPLIMPGVMQHWSASTKWNNPQYLHQLTLGGHRQVPVEIGKSYTDSNWSQQLMTYRQFFQTYLIPADPDSIGYLAQHDLFAQIPTLRSDIIIPDYCFTTPPDPEGDVLLTAGLKQAPQLADPMLNAWLGPKGTQTPLHTDPYHNILCQVVGYKYIRLYPPSETEKIYPRGIDEKGISLENTSQVEVSQFVPVGNLVEGRRGADAQIRTEMESKFPLFAQAKYVEAVLAPGESLYIPLGWWHYVESLTTSFSVSFWWN